ncbi:MAG TPA: hypothetical protein VGP82_04280, partial [Ktedonobacterales bacterium]|nr:hypothetical protein [Ktedonobacterales bacterium]
EPPAFTCPEQIVVSTLIARGVPTSSIVMELDDELCRRITGAEVVLLADAPRLPHMLHPGTFNCVVLDVLRRVYPSQCSDVNERRMAVAG